MSEGPLPPGRRRHAGVTPVDTADVYGTGHDEGLVGRAPGAAASAWCSPPGRASPPPRRASPSTPAPNASAGRGLLAGAATGADRFPADELRSRLPRLSGGQPRPQPAHRRAGGRGRRAPGASPAQVALAWLPDRFRDVIPIPGTRRVGNIDANVAAVAVRLDDDDRARLDDAALVAAGDRYPPNLMDLPDPEVRPPGGPRS